MTKQPKSRNPAGLATKKPIALRLTPSDRAEAVRLSEKLGVSLSLLAYRAYRAGLKTVMSEDSNSSSKPRAKRGISRGGAANPRAAASLSK